MAAPTDVKCSRHLPVLELDNISHNYFVITTVKTQLDLRKICVLSREEFLIYISKNI